ncbi:MAG TPA: hemolysin III family protein [Treponemataceae bacterium]|nr:hemolysin III family protein [Treponemataceae bacterium]
MSDKQNTDVSPRENAQKQIKTVKTQAKQKIRTIKHELKIALLEENTKAIDRACKQENRARYREVKREVYMLRSKRYTNGEEIFNAISHGIGAGLAIAATVLLIIKAVLYAPEALRVYYITGWSLFGVSLIVLYVMSTLYHALTPETAKKVFAIFDHASIYFLIAGTYTPFCLTTLHGTFGWVLFGIIWGLAIIGITLYAIFGKRLRAASAVTYILMGWLIIIAIKPLVAALPKISLIYLAIGGIAYTVGVIFYAKKDIKWMHSIWHLFVLAGSIFHFFAVYLSI